MGYNVTLNDSEFFMAHEQTADAALALKKWLEERPDRKNPKSWEARVLAKHPILEFYMREFMWAFESDSDGNITEVEYIGESQSGHEQTIFNLIAPYVKAGSYIELHGEDGDIFRYVFDGTQCKEVKPIITWPAITPADNAAASGDPDTVVIVVKGGMVQNVYSSMRYADLDVEILDFDDNGSMTPEERNAMEYRMNEVIKNYKSIH